MSFIKAKTPAINTTSTSSKEFTPVRKSQTYFQANPCADTVTSPAEAKYRSGLFALLLASLFFSAPSFAKVYKWVDENGKTHFSDKPFDEKSEQVKMKREPTKEEIQQAKQRASKVIRHQQKVNEIYSDELETKKQNQQKQAKKAAELCKEAKKEMQYMNGKYVNYTTNEKGERYYLTDQEKNDLAAKLKEVIAKNCK